MSVSLIELVFPQQTNHHGTLFGGEGLALMDRAAFLAATRHARRTFVTAASNRIDFKAPARQGQIVELKASVVRVGHTSLTTRVTLEAEDPVTGVRHLCTEGDFVMVATDSKDPLPPLLASEIAPAAANEAANDGVCFCEILFPGMSNNYGTLFGGNALALMGKAAFVAATRKSRQIVVMAASDHIDFKAPAYQGEIVELMAKVVRIGKSSLTVSASLTAENLLSGERRRCAEGTFTMVAVDPSGKPIAAAGDAR